MGGDEPSSPPGGGALSLGAVHPVLRQEQGQVRQLRLADLQEPALRGLLLPRVRAAPRPADVLRRERLPEDLQRPEARDHVPHTPHPLQDPLGVRADQPDVRLRARRSPGVHRARPRPDGRAHRRTPGPAAGPHHPRAHPRLRVRPHPEEPAPEDRASLDRRGPGRLHARPLGSSRRHDDSRRGSDRQGAEDLQERVRGAVGTRGLQLRPRGVRVHRSALRQGGDPAVPVHLAEEHRRGQPRRHLPAGVPDQARGVRRGLRQVAEGALQALPRQAEAERFRQEHIPEPRTDVVQRGLRRGGEPVGRDGRRHHGEPLRGGGRHRPALVTRRLGHQPPHGTDGPLREPLAELHGPGHRAVPRLRPERRHRGFLRPDGEGAQPLPGLGPRRPHRQTHSRRPRRGHVPLPSPRRAPRRLRGPEGGGLGHLDRGPRQRPVQEPDPGRVLRLRSAGLSRREPRSSTAGG